MGKTIIITEEQLKVIEKYETAKSLRECYNNFDKDKFILEYENRHKNDIDKNNPKYFYNYEDSHYYKVKYQDSLYESLITTYPLKSLFNSLKKDNLIYKSQYWITNENNGVKSLKLNCKNYDMVKIKQKCDFYGYFISYEQEIDIENKIYQLDINAKYDIEVTNDIIDIPLFHLTDLKKYDKISKNGLIPKDGCKIDSHPERVYFTYSPETFVSLLSNNNFNKGIENFAVINFVPFKTNPYRFFLDPKTPNSVYTLDTINPNYLNFIDVFSMDKMDYVGMENLETPLNEENKELRMGKQGYPLPPKLLEYLTNIYNEVKDLDNINTIAGFKRLKNIISRNGVLTYEWLKRIKNFFDSFERMGGNESNITFYLNGGKFMKQWVNSRLDQAENTVKGAKQTKKDIGMNNAFIKKHNKVK